MNKATHEDAAKPASATLPNTPTIAIQTAAVNAHPIEAIPTKIVVVLESDMASKTMKTHIPSNLANDEPIRKSCN